jgi:hypothetical protein
MSTHRDAGENAPAIAAAAGSLVLSALVLLRRPLVNNDGVYYLLAAEAYARDGFAAARAVYLWPFYSVLVAAVAAALRVSVETAAHLVGAALLATACAAFVSVVRALGGDRRVQWLAAAVVLCHPWVNHARDHVVRDFGVWAFGLLALGALLRFDGAPRAGAAARWAAWGLAAVFFRPDAAALMAAAPFAIGLRRDLDARRRILAALAVLLPALAGGAWALIWMTSHPYVEVSSGYFRRSAAALAASFPLPYGREYAPLLLATGLAVLPMVKTLKTLGPAHVALSAAGLGGARPANAFHRAALVATLAAAMVPLYVQAARLLFVESRYTVFATLVLAVFAAFGAAWAAGRSRAAAVAVVLALAVTLAASLPLRRPREDHVREAAAWIRAHGGGARLHTNSLQVAWLSGARVDWPLVHQANVKGPIDGAALRPGDLWAVRVGPEGGALRGRLAATPHFAPRAAFEGPGGDAVLVYACTSPAGCISGR